HAGEARRGVRDRDRRVFSSCPPCYYCGKGRVPGGCAAAVAIAKQDVFYVMRTDALDRFATRLEQRSTAEQIRAMMQRASVEEVTPSAAPRYWCMSGYKTEWQRNSPEFRVRCNTRQIGYIGYK